MVFLTTWRICRPTRTATSRNSKKSIKNADQTAENIFQRFDLLKPSMIPPECNPKIDSCLKTTQPLADTYFDSTGDRRSSINIEASKSIRIRVTWRGQSSNTFSISLIFFSTCFATLSYTLCTNIPFASYLNQSSTELSSRKLLGWILICSFRSCAVNLSGQITFPQYVVKDSFFVWAISMTSPPRIGQIGMRLHKLYYPWFAVNMEKIPKTRSFWIQAEPIL